jgi:hypothetical protein
MSTLKYANESSSQKQFEFSFVEMQPGWLYNEKASRYTFLFLIPAIQTTNIPSVTIESRPRLIPYTSFHFIIHQPY